MGRFFYLGRDTVFVHEIFETILTRSLDFLPWSADALRVLDFMLGLSSHKCEGFSCLLQQILIGLVIHHHRSLKLMMLHCWFYRRIIDSRSAILPHDLFSPPEHVLLFLPLPQIHRILEFSLHNKTTLFDKYILLSRLLNRSVEEWIIAHLASLTSDLVVVSTGSAFYFGLDEGSSGLGWVELFLLLLLHFHLFLLDFEE